MTIHTYQQYRYCMNKLFFLREWLVGKFKKSKLRVTKSEIIPKCKTKLPCLCQHVQIFFNYFSFNKNYKTLNSKDNYYFLPPLQRRLASGDEHLLCQKDSDLAAHTISRSLAPMTFSDRHLNWL